MEAIGGNAGFGFSAKPQVIHRSGVPFRDPYREYVYLLFS